VSEEDVVKKVGDLMNTLDEVKKYRELASAMVDFVGIFVASLIVLVSLNLVQDAYDVAFGWPSSTGSFETVIGGMPSNIFLSLATLFIPLAGLLTGYLWVKRRVNMTKVGEWKDSLSEGAPGAVKLLSGMEWDAVLSMVRNSRAAFLFYELVKIVGYSVLAYILLWFFTGFTGLVALNSAYQGYLLFLAVVVVLLLTRQGLAEGYAKLQSLDLLFWDLRVFSTEFKRAEFNKA
jgi:hypothetical protein